MDIYIYFFFLGFFYEWPILMRGGCNFILENCNFPGGLFAYCCRNCCYSPFGYRHVCVYKYEERLIVFFLFFFYCSLQQYFF